MSAALARAIRHVALTYGEIQKLPDNYAAAVATPGAVTAFDAANPAPFLPKDLMADDGPWIGIAPTGDDGMAATVHFKTFKGRSVFEVRMRHPEGRAAGEAYLKKLAAFPNPLVEVKPERESGTADTRGPWVNPETPQFPPGTMWALVRREMLADPAGQPVASPLVESVQIRVYRTLERQPANAQTFFEWETRHALLLGKGGFHLTTAEDLWYAHFPHLYEPPQRPRENGLNCYQCHGGEGIHSLGIRVRLFEEQLRRPPDFRPVTRTTSDRDAGSDSMAVLRARPLPGWALLQWLWGAPK